MDYETCANSTAFRSKVMNFESTEMAGGAGAFFIDIGLPDLAESQAVCTSPYHAHYYGNNVTEGQAYVALLLDFEAAMKQAAPGSFTILNGDVAGHVNYKGLTTIDIADGFLWESFLRTSYPDEAHHVADWQTTYKRAVADEKIYNGPNRKTWGKLLVLSFPWTKDEAYLCYATAKLCNFPYSAGLGINDAQHAKFGGHFGTWPELISLRLGSVKNVEDFGGNEDGGAYYRIYQQGVVVVNPTASPVSVNIDLGGAHNFMDVYSGDQLAGDHVNMTIPANSGRVFRYD